MPGQGTGLDRRGAGTGNKGLSGVNLIYQVNVENSGPNQISVYQQLRARNTSGKFGGAGKGSLESALAVNSEIPALTFGGAASAANFANKKVPPNTGSQPITVLVAVAAGSTLPIALDMLGYCPVP